jgi:hypothetical protein
MANGSGEIKFISKTLFLIITLSMTAILSLGGFAIQQTYSKLNALQEENHKQDMVIDRKAEPCEVREIVADELAKWELKLRKEGYSIVVIKN